MSNEKQMNLFDSVKMEATEKKYQPLYEPTAEDIELAHQMNAEQNEVVAAEEPEPVEEVHVYVAENEAEMIQEEEESYDEPMYQGVDGVWYPESEWKSPIAEDGPTRQEVEEWKSKHKRIYFLPFEDGIYIFRALKRPEYKEIIRNADLSSLDREEQFAERCVLFPRDFTIQKANEIDAGIVSVLSDAIMEKSGFMAKTGIIKL